MSSQTVSTRSRTSVPRIVYLHRYADAAAHANRGLALARSTGQGEVAPFLVPVLVTVLHTTGHVTEAADLLDEALEAARLSGNAETLGWNLLSRGYVAVAAGDIELALDVAQESVDVTRDLDDRLVSTYARWAFASALLEKGDAGRAVEILMAAAEGKDLPRIPETWRAHYFELLTRCWLAFERPVEAAETAARAGRRGGTSRDHGRHRDGQAEPPPPWRSRAGTRRPPPTRRSRRLRRARRPVPASMQRAAARLRGGRWRPAGDQDRAIAELERAADELEACGARRYRAEAEHELRKLGRRFARRHAAS